MSRDSMEFDIVIVGAGPAGLSAAIRLAQLFKKEAQEITIAVIEKSKTLGGHIISGAVLEPRALNELLPNWQIKTIPLLTPAKKDQFFYLTETSSFRLPTPPMMQNSGNYIISLSKFCQFLAEEAESLGVNIFPGFAASDIIYENNKVCGIITGDKGVDKNNHPKNQFQPGIEIRAKQTLIAEGCRGSLAKSLIAHYQLDNESDPQTYGLGIKEVWEIPEALHESGSIIHTIGWPLDSHTYGGSFIYHFSHNLISLGLVVGLDYTNPYLNPYEEFQRFKLHPFIYSLLKKGKRIAYGARAVIEGGLQSLPKLTFPGGMLLGDSVGFLNVPKMKGIHNSMKSGMIAAESIVELLKLKTESECYLYTKQIKKSWIYQELHQARNIRPAFRFGLFFGLAYSAIDAYLFRGHAPWTLHHRQPDYATLTKANQSQQISYPKHDNVVSFDLMSSVYLTNSEYNENQPCHLKLKKASTPIDINLREYAAPEQRYCPAGVYEIQNDINRQPYLQINAANCIHCKACDIKDPTQNIVWTTPEGGSGPQYDIL
jgi:electron-transferring-flavoprotein dehydrogenase